MTSEALSLFRDSLTDATNIRESTFTPPSPAIAGSQHGAVVSVIAVPSAAQQISDETLLFRVNEQDREALALLFRRHAHTVLGIARRILRDDSEAEDLLQDLFLFLFQKANLFDPEKSSALSWVIQMTYQRTIDRKRYLDSRHHYNTCEFHEEQVTTARGQVSIDELTCRRLMDKLREQLSPEQRQTLELHFFEGYTFGEIAEKTGQTFGNVRNHYYRGLARLRSLCFPGKR